MTLWAVLGEGENILIAHISKEYYNHPPKYLVDVGLVGLRYRKGYVPSGRWDCVIDGDGYMFCSEKQHAYRIEQKPVLIETDQLDYIHSDDYHNLLNAMRFLLASREAK